MGLCLSKQVIIESNNAVIERNAVAKLPKDVFIKIMSLLSPPTLAAVRDVLGMKEAFKGLTATELENINVPNDINTPVPSDQINTIKPVVLQKNGQLTTFGKQVISQSPYATSNELIFFAKNINLNSRAAVARHSNTPAKVLITMSTDADPDVRAGVARNPNTPAEVLITISTDADPDVREGVARNPTIPAEV